MSQDYWDFSLTVFFVLVSSLCSTIGIFFQKIAQGRFTLIEKMEDSAEKQSYWRRTVAIFLCGILLVTLISFPFDMYAMNILGQALVMPLLAGLQVAENQALAPYFFEEVFLWSYDGVAVRSILVGVTTTTLFGPGSPLGSEVRPEGSFDFQHVMAELGRKWTSLPFIFFEVGVVVAVGLCLYFKETMKENERYPRARILMYGFVAGTSQGQHQAIVKILGALFACLAQEPEVVLSDPTIYLYGALTAAGGIITTYYINMGLRRFGALEFVPLQVMLMMIMGALTGLFFDQEYDLLKVQGWILFFSGIGCISHGLNVLTSKPVAEKANDVSDGKDGALPSGAADEAVDDAASDWSSETFWSCPSRPTGVADAAWPGLADAEHKTMNDSKSDSMSETTMTGTPLPP